MIHFLRGLFRKPEPAERSEIVARLNDLADRKRLLMTEHAILVAERDHAIKHKLKRSHITARLEAVTTELLSIG